MTNFQSLICLLISSFLIVITLLTGVESAALSCNSQFVIILKSIQFLHYDKVESYFSSNQCSLEEYHRALIKAIGTSDLQMVKTVLESTNIDPSIYDNKAISLASMQPNVDIITELLKYDGVVVDAQDNLPIINAVKAGLINMVEFYLAMGNSINAGAQNNRALINSIQFKHEKIFDILVEHPQVNPADPQSMPIVEAVKTGDIRVVKKLLSIPGVDASVDGNKPLIIACTHGYVDIVDILIKKGRVNPAYPKNKAIKKAAKYGNVKVIERLLQESVVDPSAQNDAALTKALINRRIEVVKLLLKQPSVDPLSNDRKPLEIALGLKDTELIQILLDHPKVSAWDMLVKASSASRVDMVTFILLIQKEWCSVALTIADINENDYSDVQFLNEGFCRWLAWKKSLKDKKVGHLKMYTIATLNGKDDFEIEDLVVGELRDEYRAMYQRFYDEFYEGLGQFQINLLDQMYNPKGVAFRIAKKRNIWGRDETQKVSNSGDDDDNILVHEEEYKQSVIANILNSLKLYDINCENEVFISMNTWEKLLKHGVYGFTNEDFDYSFEYFAFDKQAKTVDYVKAVNNVFS